MNLFIPSWEKYPKKMKKRLQRLEAQGSFSSEEAKQKQMRLAIGSEKGVTFYWLVDPQDGVIADARFEAFGPPSLLAAADAAAELLLRKTYAQASRLSVDLIEKQLKNSEESLPSESASFLNWIVMAIEEASASCSDIPLASTYEETPVLGEFLGPPGGLPGWEALDDRQKIHLIEEVIEKEIRPYIELDAGGITLAEFKNSKEVHISYQGSCTSCHASTGSTLSAIQNILSSRLHPSLIVIPVVSV